MYNEPTEEELSKVPGLCETDGVPLSEKNVYFHFFCGNSDWWILEYDPNDRLFFGIAKIFVHELGYISFDEMKEAKAFGVMEVERDLNFDVKKVKDVDALKGWLNEYGYI